MDTSREGKLTAMCEGPTTCTGKGVVIVLYVPFNENNNENLR